MTNATDSEARRLGKLILIAAVVGLLGETIAYLWIGRILVWLVAILCVALTLAGRRGVAYSVFLVTLLNVPEYSRYITMEDIYTLRTVSVYGVSLAVCLIGFFMVYEILTRLHLGFLTVPRGMAILSVWLLFPVVIGLGRVSLGETRFSAYQDDLQYWLVVLASAFVALRLKARNIHNIITASLIARPIVIVFAWVVGLGQGDYGGRAIATYDPIDDLTTVGPILLVLLKPTDFRFYGMLMLSTLCLIGVQLLEPSGKSLILLPLLMVLGFFLMRRRARIVSTIVYGLITMIIVGAAIGLSGDWLKSSLLEIKFEQVVSLAEAIVSAGEGNAIGVIARSPRIRVLEMLNIYADLTQASLWQLLFGRGLGGHFTDVWMPMQGLSTVDFSAQQITVREFYKVHQSVNYVLLKSGIIGVLLWCVVMLVGLWNIGRTREPLEVSTRILWLVLVAFYLGYSVKLAILLGTITAVLLRRGRGEYGGGEVLQRWTPVRP